MFPIMEVAATPLQVLWFILVAVLWIGFFFLEGFDFGVGMLLPFLGKKDEERRVMINTIGPVWDGNEVWLLTAGGATFAAFPGWYSTLFSALYLPLLLVLTGLILRGISFEYRGKTTNPTWHKAFDWCATIGSFLPPLVLGVGFANFVIGLPVGQVNGVPYLFTGTFLGLFSLYGLLGGVLFVALFVTHGAAYMALKTKGVVHERTQRTAMIGGVVTAVLMLVFVLVGQMAHGGGAMPAVQWIVGIVAVVGLLAVAAMSRAGRDGFAFISGGLSVLTMIVMIFLHMWPNLGFDNGSNQGPALNAMSAASTELTLTIMTIAAVIFVPIVLAYQTWTYTVFRRRIGVEDIAPYEMPDSASTTATAPEPA